MKKENRFTDDQIQSMIEIGYGSRSIRKFRVSPKRVARIERRGKTSWCAKKVQ